MIYRTIFEESRVKGQGSSIASSENAKRKTLKDNTARSADTPATPSVVYRLNIVGDNGIEWRINVDSRLLSPSAKSKE